MDCKRQLFSNVVVSGGSSKFKDYDRRFERELKKRV